MTETENSRSKEENQGDKRLRSKEAGYKIIKEEMKRLDGISGLDTARVPVKISGQLFRAHGISKCYRINGELHPGEIVISKQLAECGTTEHLQNTVRHEYAHMYVDTRDNMDHKHDYAWRAAAIKFGCDGNTKTNYSEVSYTDNCKYTLICNGCQRVWHYSRRGKTVNAFLKNPNTTAYRCTYCGSNSFSLKCKEN